MARPLSWQSFVIGEYAVNSARIMSAILAILILLLFYDWMTAFHVNTSANSDFPTRTAIRPIADIDTWHLFGTHFSQTLNADDLPITAMNIQLVGLMLATPARYSQVLIAIPGEAEKIYTVGDSIPGGAKIDRITADGVILRRGGKLESLRLPIHRLAFASQPAEMNVQQKENG